MSEREDFADWKSQSNSVNPWMAWQARADLAAEEVRELEAERRLMARLLDEWQDNWNSSMMPDGDLINDTNAMLAQIDAPQQENSDEG